MAQASSLFSQEDHQRVDQAVAAAEGRTSAEIVPVIAASSGRYDRAEDIVGVWLALICACVAWLFLSSNRSDAGHWGGRSPVVDVLILIGAIIGGFVAGAMAGGHIAWLRRLFTPARQMRQESALRARQVFFDSRVHHTAGRSGLLIYVSLYERTAVLLADQTVLEKLGQPALDELCADLTAGLAGGRIIESLCITIEHVGARLAEVLPVMDGDRNEIGNALVVIQ